MAIYIYLPLPAMSAAYLGYFFDIHGGGMDLIFPHHENEIAQSCAACKKSNVSYWIHNGFVTIDSEKMSKSLGNFFTIRQVNAMILETIKEGNIVPSELTVKLIQREVESSENDKFLIDGFPRTEENRRTYERVVGAEPNIVLFFDCPEEEMVKRVLSRNQGRVDDNIDTVKKRLEVFNALNLPIINYYSEKGKLYKVLQQLMEKALKRAKLTEDQVLQKIEERTSARMSKEYEKSDSIRKELADVGIAHK
ncbi:hypothetical protein RHGRI_007663 [Rhododendron griersonianum]|uniref:adenylate kinase n=1 Tax=Rhododendron griersonianum TaxID=479676 RepID=A0AAV6KXM6_9ERIC|nr:hypothetical protein RHGRI_007663 [Rhododendron griersonianum]